MALEQMPTGAPANGRSSRRTRRGLSAQAGPVRAILYARVSTTDQAENGGSLSGQLESLDRLSSERGWLVVDRLTDERSGSNLERAGIAEALGRLATGDANLLAVSRLDRLSRSVQDFANLVQQSRDEGWRLVIADIGYDGTSPAGELVANVLSALSQWERRMIGTRTSEGIAALKREGRYQKIKVSPEVRDRIIRMRASGLTYQAMADALNAEGMASPAGKTWGPKTAWGIAQGSYRSEQDQTTPLSQTSRR